MEIPEIDVDELERQQAGGAPVFDVRESDEWDNARLEGATLVPLGTVPESVADFPKDRTVYVICAKGGRSARAVEFLRAEGVDAVNVAGGMGAWLKAGKPSLTGNGS